MFDEMIVESCPRKEIKGFVEQHHYSKNINGLSCKHNFKLILNGQIIGACIFGEMAMCGVWQKYASRKQDLLELRRLCCIDNTPKNTESFFIGKCLLWIKKNTKVKKVISYADLTYNHTGVIYQATNFILIGQTSKGRVIMYNGKRYHDKTIRTKYKGQLKPFALKIRNALETGEAKYTVTKPKNIYLYDLETRRKRYKRGISNG